MEQWSIEALKRWNDGTSLCLHVSYSALRPEGTRLHRSTALRFALLRSCAPILLPRAQRRLNDWLHPGGVESLGHPRHLRLGEHRHDMPL